MKTTHYIIWTALISCALISCNGSPQPFDLSKVQLPSGVVLFNTDSIAEVGDLDGDGAKDRFAYVKKGADSIGFVVGLTTQGNYVFCDWPEASLNPEETSYEFKLDGTNLKLDILSRYTQSTLVLAYAPELTKMIFKEYMWGYFTTDNYVTSQGTLKLKGDVYACESEGKVKQLSQKALPMAAQSPLFTLCE